MTEECNCDDCINDSPCNFDCDIGDYCQGCRESNDNQRDLNSTFFTPIEY